MEFKFVERDRRRQRDCKQYAEREIPAQSDLVKPTSAVDPRVEVADDIGQVTVLPFAALALPSVRSIHETGPGAGFGARSVFVTKFLERTRELRILDERFRIPRSTAVGLGCGFAQCFESEECGLTAENFRFVSANLLFDSSNSELVALTVDEGK